MSQDHFLLLFQDLGEVVAYTLEQIVRKISLAQASLLMLFVYRLKSLEVLAPLKCNSSCIEI